MPSDKLTLEVYPDAEAIDSEKPTVFHGLDYVSFVNDSSYGAPALVAPNPKDGAHAKPRAQPGEKVVYVNTSLIPLFSLERVRS